MRLKKSCYSNRANCEVVVHGNGFLAKVRTFDVSRSESQPITPGALKPGDTVRLEIVPEKDGLLTIQLGMVQWVDGDTVEVKIILIDTADKEKLDEAAWSSVRGELRLFRWLRKSFWRNDVQHLNLSFAPRVHEKSSREPVAA